MSVFNVYLLRHGELVQSGILCGRSDIALSDTGKQQLIAATSNLPEIHACYSSPLVRCREFAEQYSQQHELSLQVLTQLQEMNFGDWDGKSYQALWQSTPEGDLTTANTSITLGDFWQYPWQYTPPNGETMEDFTARVDHFWHQVLLQLSQAHYEESTSSNTLVFSHGGVIRYLLAKVLGLPIPGTHHMTNLDVPYGGLIHLQVVIDDNGNAWPKLML